MLPSGSSDLPGTVASRLAPARQKASNLLSALRRFSLLFGLAPGGGYLAAPIAGRAGGLLHHLFTLTSDARGRSWRCVSVARSDRLLHPGCYPAPCSLECGLSSTQRRNDAAPRSPSQPGHFHHTPRWGGLSIKNRQEFSRRFILKKDSLLKE